MDIWAGYTLHKNKRATGGWNTFKACQVLTHELGNISRLDFSTPYSVPVAYLRVVQGHTGWLQEGGSHSPLWKLNKKCLPLPLATQAQVPFLGSASWMLLLRTWTLVQSTELGRAHGVAWAVFWCVCDRQRISGKTPSCWIKLSSMLTGWVGLQLATSGSEAVNSPVLGRLCTTLSFCFMEVS
jgi:hypothetical protein